MGLNPILGTIHGALDFSVKVATLSRWRNGFETRMRCIENLGCINSL